MDSKSFNNELALANIQFMSIFSGIVITRELKNGKSKDIIVPCVFSERSRILKNIENPDLATRQPLPMICIERGGITRSQERVANLHLETKLAASPGRININQLTPNPIDISYTVTMVTKYPSDMDKILSNFVPFFNSDVYVRVPNPKHSGEFLKCQVLWDGSINKEGWTGELDHFSDDIQIMTTSFTYKTYMFGGTGTIAPIEFTGIKEIGSLIRLSLEEIFNTYSNGKSSIDIHEDIPYGDINPQIMQEIEKLVPDGILTLELAKEIDEKTGKRVLVGPAFYAVPVSYSSAEKYIEDVYSDKIENPEVDIYHIVKNVDGNTQDGAFAVI